MKNVFHISPKKFEEDLSDTDLNFSSNYSAEFLNIPPMLEVYWDRIYTNAIQSWEENKGINIVPSQAEFVQYYMNKHSDKFDKYSDNKQDGIRARVLKAYPSLTREAHFIALVNKLLIQEDFPYTLIISNSRLDLSRGVDLAIQINGVSFSINITKTDSSTDWQKIKAKRKEEVDNPHSVTVVAEEENTFEIGHGETLFLIKQETVRETLEQCVDIAQGEK